MTPKRIVLIGGPSTGKTTLLNALESRGYKCLQEVSREVIQAAQQEGIEQLFLSRPLLFSEKLLERRVKQFREVANFESDLVFIDRGIPDVPAYMDYVGQDYPDSFNQACETYRYDEVFVLPSWKEIHTTDSERYESFEQALSIQKALIETYKKYNYNPIDVPKASVEDRVSFLLNHLK